MTSPQSGELHGKFFTAENCITSSHRTQHIHIRDALNETPETYLDPENVNAAFSGV